MDMGALPFRVLLLHVVYTKQTDEGIQHRSNQAQATPPAGHQLPSVFFLSVLLIVGLVVDLFIEPSQLPFNRLHIEMEVSLRIDGEGDATSLNDLLGNPAGFFVAYVFCAFIHLPYPFWVSRLAMVPFCQRPLPLSVGIPSALS
jgi:hypothetical protein